jgi:hypothetical protein
LSSVRVADICIDSFAKGRTFFFETSAETGVVSLHRSGGVLVILGTIDAIMITLSFLQKKIVSLTMQLNPKFSKLLDKSDSAFFFAGSVLVFGR